MTGILDAITAPDETGAPSLSKRNGPKTLLPGRSIGRSVSAEYVVCGQLRQTTGALLDLYLAGVILNAAGARTMIGWECIASVDLQAD